MLEDLTISASNKRDSDRARINEQINIPEVRLIDVDGNRAGIVSTSEALRAGLRLLEHEERQVVELRERLKRSLSQADDSEFVDADGKNAVRNIFASVRAAQT